MSANVSDLIRTMCQSDCIIIQGSGEVQTAKSGIATLPADMRLLDIQTLCYESMPCQHECTMTSLPGFVPRTVAEVDAARAAHPQLFVSRRLDGREIFAALKHVQFRVPAFRAHPLIPAATHTRCQHETDLKHFLMYAGDASEKDLALQWIDAWMKELYAVPTTSGV